MTSDYFISGLSFYRQRLVEPFVVLTKIRNMSVLVALCYVALAPPPRHQHLRCFHYPRRAWAATGIVVLWFVCL